MITQSQLAREIGISQQAVCYKLRKGMTVAQIREEAVNRARAVAAGHPLPRSHEAGRSKKAFAEEKAKQAQNGTLMGYVPRSAQKLLDAAAASAANAVKAPRGPVVFDERYEKPDNELGESLQDAQTRKEIALADKNELANAVTRGELASVSVLNNWFTGCIIKCRDLIMNIPEELGDKLASMHDPIEIRMKLDKELRRALAALKLFASSKQERAEAAERLAAGEVEEPRAKLKPGPKPGSKRK